MIEEASVDGKAIGNYRLFYCISILENLTKFKFENCFKMYIIYSMVNIEEIRDRLKQLSFGNEEYAFFCKRIINTKKKIMGVQVPPIRKIAKELKKASFVEMKQFWQTIDKNIYEEVFLFGLAIKFLELSDEEKIKLIKIYLQDVDSWAFIDSVCSAWNKFDEKLWWNFCAVCCQSSQEFVCRFGIIFMMSNFLNQKYLTKIFICLRKIKSEDYYVQMATAWLFATAAVKFYEPTLKELQRKDYVFWVKNKAYQKMLESFRMSIKQKTEIRKLRTLLKTT